MATEILLMANVEELGQEGDVVTVADGYARNYLLPRGLGAKVSEATRRKLAKMRVDRESDQMEELKRAQEKAAGLKDISCTITVKTGEDDKLFGSVTATQVLDALKAQGVELDRQNIVMEQPLKDLGVFDIPVKLHSEVESTVKVWVVEE